MYQVIACFNSTYKKTRSDVWTDQGMYTSVRVWVCTNAWTDESRVKVRVMVILWTLPLGQSRASDSDGGTVTLPTLTLIITPYNPNPNGFNPL